MFQVNINTEVIIKECPKSGLAAVDFRREAGLPEAATNKVSIKLFRENWEEICRRFPGYLNDEADLVIGGLCDANAALSCPRNQATETSRHYYNYGARFRLPAESLVGILRDADEGGINSFVIALIESSRKDDEESSVAYAAYAAEKAARQAEDDARRAAWQRNADAQRAQQAAGIEALKTWALANGSKLLVARVADKFDWQQLAGKEFAQQQIESLEALPIQLANDYPDGFDNVDITERTTPNLKEIQLLRDVRSSLQDRPTQADLVWMKYSTDDDPDKELTRCEIRVNITDPTGKKHDYFFLPSS